MSSTSQTHFKDNGGHLSKHEQITLHIKYTEPHVFLSPYHNHHSHHNAKAVIIQSIATVRSQFAIITHIIVSSAALRTLLAGWLCAWGCGLTRRCVSY